MIIIVNGQGGTGKTFFENKCCQVLAPYGNIVSTIDFIKEIALKCGWDGVKTDEWRKKLSDLKAFLAQWDDTPWKAVMRTIKNLNWKLEFEDFDHTKAIFFIDSREPAEIERYVKELNAKTVLVRRPQCEHEFNNASDNNVFNYNYDFIIDNSGTKEDLNKQIKLFLDWLKENGYPVTDLYYKRLERMG